MMPTPEKKLGWRSRERAFPGRSWKEDGRKIGAFEGDVPRSKAPDPQICVVSKVTFREATLPGKVTKVPCPPSGPAAPDKAQGGAPRRPRRKPSSATGFRARLGPQSGDFREMEWVTARADRAIRFSTPTLRIILAMCALTVRSSIPRAAAISRFDFALTSSAST